VLDLRSLREENAALRERLAAQGDLQQENAALRSQIAELTQVVAKLNERVGELLAVAKRKQQKPAADKPPGDAPVVEGKAKRTFEDRPKPPDKPSATKRTNKPVRPTGRQPLPSHLPAEEHDLRSDRCEHCGSQALDAADVVIEEKLHVVKEHQRRRVVRRTTCRCRDCGGRTTPRSLPAPYERSKVTSEWLAWMVYSKFSLLTPLDRIRRDLKERGVPLAMSTLVAFVERAADLLSPIDGLHWRQLLTGSWMATDGTGLKVLIPKLPKAHNGYIELYRNHDLAVFQYAADKSGEDVVRKLRPFRGKLTADAESRFNAVFASGDIVETGCNAHGRRKFRDAEDTQPLLAVEGGGFLSAIYDEEEKAKLAGLAGEALRDHRQQRIGPLVDNFKAWMSAVKPTLLPSEPLAAAIRYYDNHGEALFRFVDDADVPIDNSPTEREFQNVAKLRLNMLFAGSTEGAHRACVLLGIVATCRAIGVSAQAYLAWAFDRLGTHRHVFGLDLADMTPAAFKKTLG
jgi:transposase